MKWCREMLARSQRGMRKMEPEDPAAFRLYSNALQHFDEGALAAWISYLEGINGSSGQET